MLMPIIMRFELLVDSIVIEVEHSWRYSDILNI